jgi:hypothetical protein
MLRLLLLVGTLFLTLKDGVLEKHEIFLLGMGLFVFLFCVPGGDHEHEKANHR